MRGKRFLASAGLIASFFIALKMVKYKYKPEIKLSRLPIAVLSADRQARGGDCDEAELAENNQDTRYLSADRQAITNKFQYPIINILCLKFLKIIAVGIRGCRRWKRLPLMFRWCIFY